MIFMRIAGRFHLTFLASGPLFSSGLLFLTGLVVCWVEGEPLPSVLSAPGLGGLGGWTPRRAVGS